MGRRETTIEIQTSTMDLDKYESLEVNSRLPLQELDQNIYISKEDGSDSGNATKGRWRRENKAKAQTMPSTPGISQDIKKDSGPKRVWQEGEEHDLILDDLGQGKRAKLLLSGMTMYMRR